MNWVMWAMLCVNLYQAPPADAIGKREFQACEEERIKLLTEVGPPVPRIYLYPEEKKLYDRPGN